MTTSKCLAERKSAKFKKNIHKRGVVPETSIKRGMTIPWGLLSWAFFVFVVIGSALLQIISTATSGAIA
ncbi:hypothetical protein GOP47_0019102 [Adiantum capillus-veneris]|uniref:Uncharacterized protein n=1 Tax=Adiantum capillus-veneris TaxID=13818 RepID=A0A9D4UEF7_ADICA|nr:hypothetical protein GOP47_0019102 [Adiantum capillus-veneris]